MVCRIVRLFVILELYEICLVRARDKLKILRDAGANSDTDSISSFTGPLYVLSVGMYQICFSKSSQSRILMANPTGAGGGFFTVATT